MGPWHDVTQDVFLNGTACSQSAVFVGCVIYEKWVEHDKQGQEQDQNSEEFYIAAVSLETGKLIWKNEFFCGPGEFYIHYSKASNRVVVGANEYNEDDMRSELLSLDALTGETVFAQNLDKLIKNLKVAEGLIAVVIDHTPRNADSESDSDSKRGTIRRSTQTPGPYEVMVRSDDAVLFRSRSMRYVADISLLRGSLVCWVTDTGNVQSYDVPS